ncbi:uncharacterized protein LOC132707621 [Cylas formicarius]|uniref:uncharacterized protein LOC132707621 n=1 Tax=Cylas formicarius TaxID=197179 RepID=UPI002958D5B0|nr:uncharacterized protein LOC132707621 [Cylas formicarius]
MYFITPPERLTLFLMLVNFGRVECFEKHTNTKEPLKSSRNYSNNTRDPKFFWGLGFGIGLVRFENSVCTSAGNQDGTCYTRRQCAAIDGIASGTCANDIGVCCVIQRTCGDISSYNNTYFTNTDYPSPDTATTTCTMTIQPCSTDFCQARIDFLALSLAQPDPTGVCTTDALIVSGAAGPVPIICGENTGQHIYVDFNGNNSVQLTITTNGAIAFNRLWAFRVIQIACACPTRAPVGCLMYYTTESGTVNSFNYGTTTNVIDPNTGVAGTRELILENYGICIAMLPGYCGIQWSSNNFMVSGNANNVGIGALTDGDCNSDFVVIPNPYYVNGTAVNSDRFCGLAFDDVVSYTKPFALYVVTNGDEVNDTMNIGFSLSFMQVACTNSLVNNIFG